MGELAPLISPSLKPLLNTLHFTFDDDNDFVDGLDKINVMTAFDRDNVVLITEGHLVALNMPTGKCHYSLPLPARWTRESIERLDCITLHLVILRIRDSLLWVDAISKRVSRLLPNHRIMGFVSIPPTRDKSTYTALLERNLSREFPTSLCGCISAYL